MLERARTAQRTGSWEGVRRPAPGTACRRTSLPWRRAVLALQHEKEGEGAARGRGLCSGDGRTGMRHSCWLAPVSLVKHRRGSPESAAVVGHWGAPEYPLLMETLSECPLLSLLFFFVFDFVFNLACGGAHSQTSDEMVSCPPPLVLILFTSTQYGDQPCWGNFSSLPFGTQLSSFSSCLFKHSFSFLF